MPQSYAAAKKNRAESILLFCREEIPAVIKESFHFAQSIPGGIAPYNGKCIPAKNKKNVTVKKIRQTDITPADL